MIRVELKDGEVRVEPQIMEIFDEKFYRAADPDRNKRPSVFLFNKVVAFANHYHNLNTKSRQLFEDIESICGAGKSKGLSEARLWCETYLSDIKESAEMIRDFIDIAKASGNQILFAIACSAIVNDMRDLSIEGFRKKYKIQNDLTADETAQLQKEDELWKKINIEEEETLEEEESKEVVEAVEVVEAKVVKDEAVEAKVVKEKVVEAIEVVEAKVVKDEAVEAKVVKEKVVEAKVVKEEAVEAKIVTPSKEEPKEPKAVREETKAVKATTKPAATKGAGRGRGKK